MKTQDPKYDIENGRLVNAVTRVPIPEDEPIFILRAKDENARGAIDAYIHMCSNGAHIEAVIDRYKEFWQFATKHHERMKEPD